MGVDTTIFFIWLVNHHKNVKRKSKNPKEFFYDAGTVEKQTSLSPYQQNKLIKKLEELNLLKVVGRKRYNRK